MDGRDYEKMIKERGLKKVWIAEQMGITRVTLTNKLSGRTKFSRSEKIILEAILRGEKIN